MKFQTIALSLVAALGLVSSETTRARRLRSNGGAKLSKSDSSTDRSLQSVFFPKPPPPPRPAMKNVVMILIDDVSNERFPESGNTALQGKLPGIQELKEDGAVYYPHFQSGAPICAPAQSGMFVGFDPGMVGTHQQFSEDNRPGKAAYATVPPPEVMFLPEYMRSQGYYATGAGKLDYQIGTVYPTFFNKVIGPPWVNVCDIMEDAWTPAVEYGMPFFTVLNMMDNHEQFTSFIKDNPTLLSDSLTKEQPTDLPFNGTGYATSNSLIFRKASGGDPVAMPVRAVDLINEYDIVDYVGDFDEDTLTHANKGLPSFVYEEKGMKSIFAREYDLIRNVDWKVAQIVRRLKEENLYDDTAIFLFGDHGSGSFKGKFFLQRQSVNPPLWVKLPKDVPLSPAIVKGDDGYNVDPRLTNMKDAYPTVLSILGLEPLPFNDGRAVAGMYEDTGPEPEAIFAMVHRSGSVIGWKTHSAYNKEFYYQRHAFNKEAVDARAALNMDPADTIERAYRDMQFVHRYDSFRISPSYHRAKRLMYINAENSEYPSSLRYMTTDGTAPPAEALFDLRTDPYGTENLLMEYKYTSVYGDTMQSWGNFVTKITLEYGPLDLSRLDDYQLENYNKLKDLLLNWTDGLRYSQDGIDWSEGLWGEENKMAREFWPTGEEPETEVASVDNDGNFVCETEGAVVQFSAVSLDDRKVCEVITSEMKEANEVMTPVANGLPMTDFVSVRNGRSYTGVYYTDGVSGSQFLGGASNCRVFVAQDLTFMEAQCDTWAPFAFDTRDSTWNMESQTWDGVNADTGEWEIDPILVYDADAGDWNYDALGPYFLGPNRDNVFTGLADDGTPYNGPTVPDVNYNDGKGYGAGMLPSPKYWATDEPVNQLPSPFSPSEGFIFKGWDLQGGSYKAVNEELDVKGSFIWAIDTRYSGMNQKSNYNFVFDSFDFKCLLWSVGASVDLDSDGDLYIFTQTHRKGYEVGPYAEYLSSGGVVSQVSYLD